MVEALRVVTGIGRSWRKWLPEVLLAVILSLLAAGHVERARLQAHDVAREHHIQHAKVYASQGAPKDTYHPPHRVKVWMLRYRGRVFRIVQLPRCADIQVILSFAPRGETLLRAKKRLGGVAVCTDGFVHSTSYALADFLQDRGRQLSRAATGRWMLVIYDTGKLDISANYMFVKGNRGVTAAALGQRLVPLQKDGFTLAFMNRDTDRMGIGLSRHHIFIAAGTSDIWRFSKLFQDVLHCRVAINTDGGHVVRGKTSTHIVFRWRPNPARPGAGRPVQSSRGGFVSRVP